MEQIERIAREFRYAINEAISESGYVGGELDTFPIASCEVTSQMLGLYLLELGYENVIATFNQRPKREPSEIGSDSHVWLVVNGSVIVDITADQYDDCINEVVVSENSKFHQTFTYYSNRELDLSRPGSSGYSEFYEQVKQRLQNV
ncbi:hypothetical protein J8Z24_08305 [Pseudoalteromonas sp. SCSIO 43201]|uniref:hypothetical protein n=1 Tax=Pseudoalteromonas sp. SCSIO 43201 TaxID=2822842 RepID=UPI002075A831|nr:hypothetical protein [Pseudoalteromonas sp. SCSIO 43201]USD30057.1 hypothetical protein J8Z24_08305 [Pseudoalteromonas sp. SCSIO 43201]